MILFTGGSGVLGTEIKNICDANILFPTSSEFNITDYNKCHKFIEDKQVHKIIHAAAYTNIKHIQTNFIQAIETNIIGTCNIVKLCELFKIKLVYISTDYVFDGSKGDYSKNDPINPLTKYAKSKAAAELTVRMYENSLVIRTSFFGNNFPYEKAFTDQLSTKDYIDVMAPKILEACLSDDIGIKHVFSKKETIFDKAIKRKHNVLPIQICEINNLLIPKDVSLV